MSHFYRKGCQMCLQLNCPEMKFQLMTSIGVDSGQCCGQRGMLYVVTFHEKIKIFIIYILSAAAAVATASRE